MNYKRHSLLSVALEMFKANPKFKKFVLIAAAFLSVFVLVVIVGVFWLMSALWSSKDLVAKGINDGAQFSQNALAQAQSKINSDCGTRLQKNWQELMAGDVFVIMREAAPLWDSCVMKSLQNST